MLQAEPLRDRDKGSWDCSGCGGGEDGSRQDVEFVYVGNKDACADVVVDEPEDKDEAKRLAFSCWCRG